MLVGPHPHELSLGGGAPAPLPSGASLGPQALLPPFYDPVTPV
jgi:hypothetical protein